MIKKIVKGSSSQIIVLIIAVSAMILTELKVTEAFIIFLKNDYKNILTIINTLCGVGVLIVAIKGLGQLKIAKDSSNITSIRESLKSASEQINLYLTKIIPLQDKLDDHIREKNIKFFNFFSTEINKGSISVKKKSGEDVPKEEVDKVLSLEFVGPYLDALNAMESFATFFTCHVADEKIAYRAIGKTYCGTVKKLMPHLIFSFENGYFRNVVELFCIWEARLEKAKIMKEKDNLDKKLLDLKDEKIITPIGLEK